MGLPSLGSGQSLRQLWTETRFPEIVRIREVKIEGHLNQFSAAIELNNREIASLVLLALAVGAAFLYPKTRTPVWGIVKLIASPLILVPFAGLAVSTYALVLLGQELGLWESALIPATVVWVLTQGAVLLYRVATRKPEEAFFRPALVRMVELTWALEVFVGLYVFDVFAELVLLVVLIILGLLSAAAASESSYQPTKRLVDGAMAFIGSGLVLYVVVSVIANWDDIDKTLVARAFFLPLGLTIGLMPYLYLLSFWASYHDAFIWINAETKDRTVRRRAKLGLILTFGPRASKLGSFRHYWIKQIAEAKSVASAHRVGREFLSDRRKQAEEKQEAADRLVRNAGVEGEDENGQRLDRREFAETKKALQRLGTMQMGWHRNRGGRYRPELIDLLHTDGLPEDHGIHLNVAQDGQSWWTWRRTITGWCFAIGAAGEPPDEWFYDGPEPPSGFPGQDPAWGERFGIDAKNW